KTGAELLGNWIDAVYLSADGQWDINDILLATISHTGGLAQNEAYTGSATVNVPGILPGNYHILVRADVANQEKEGAGHTIADNVIASDSLSIDVRALTIDGTPVSGTLTLADSSDYYAVQVPAGDSLRLSLDSISSTARTELYASLGTVPTRMWYDQKAAS